MLISYWSSDVCSSDLALQRHWRSRPGGCKIERLDQLFRSHSVLARGVGKIEIFAPGSDLAIVAQLEDCDKRNGRPFVITAGIIDPFRENDIAVRGDVEHLVPLVRNLLSHQIVLGENMFAAMHRRNRRNDDRSEEHTSELQSLLRNSYA